MTASVAQATLPVIEMHGVGIASRKDNSLRVADEVEWLVQAGEFWIIGGPQNSGKSDFLMTAGGLNAPARGEYLFLGERMPVFEEARLAHRLRLGFVFDGGQLLSQLTIAENIALPLQYHRNLEFGEAEARVRTALELTSLLPWADRLPGQLGRSWQQRAGLARALVLEPEVLMVDSPLTGLDPRHSTWWLRLLGQLARGHPFLERRPVTIIATTDYLRPWRRFANRVAFLAAGHFQVLGDWNAVTQCRDATVAELLEEEPAGD